MKATVADFAIAGVKTGMLPTREVIIEVARLFRETNLPAPVVDPVMRATSGDDLINDDAVGSLVSDFFPLAAVVTPNIPEAERLTGLAIVDEQSMKEAARKIRESGARAVPSGRERQRRRHHRVDDAQLGARSRDRYAIRHS